MQGRPSERPRSSEPRYRAATPDATEDFLFHLYRGSELLQDNRVHEAKEELEQALRLQPRDSKGQDLLAVVYFRLGLYPRAIEIYEELMRDFPNDAALAQNLSLSYLKTGQPDKARTLLEQLVMSQPDHLRAWAYLGLVHERLGDYEKARGAFERGQQPGMARRMEELLLSAVPPRSLSRPPPGSMPPLAYPKEPAEGFHVLGRETTLVGIPTLMPRVTTPIPPPPDPSASPGATSPHEAAANASPNRADGSDSSPGAPLRSDASNPAGPLSNPLSSVSGSSPERAPPGRAPDQVAPRPAGLPTLLELAKSALLAFPSAATVDQHASGLVLVRVETSFAVRPRNVQLMSGDAHGFKTTTLVRRMRNHSLDEPLGGAHAPLVSLSGSGRLALGPAGPDERLVAFRMDGDFLFLREASLVGFEESLMYENGRLAAFEGEAVALVQLRGRGFVVLGAKGAVIATEVRTDLSAVVARDAVLGWAGRLLPRELSPEEAPGGARGLISFAGDGTVFAGIVARADLL